MAGGCFSYTLRMPRLALAVLFAFAPAACSARRAGRTAASPQESFWKNLSALCGRSFEGRIAANAGGGAGPDPFEGKRLIMHVRGCGEREIRVPFHVGEDRSRTWVFTRAEAGLRLKHDHRHADGSEDALTRYGGDTAEPGTAALQSFPADPHSKALFLKAGIPQSVENVWIVGLVFDSTYSYALTRPGREFRIDFDLANPVENPPPPWGSD